MKKNARPSNVKKRIFSEAIRFFGENGFEGTSIQSIADAVGIRKPSLFYHFKSKEELREKVINALLVHLQAELQKLLTSTQSGHDRFFSMMFSLIEFFLTDHNRARLVIHEMLDRPEEVDVLVGEHIRPWTKTIVEYIRLEQVNGTFKSDIDPESYIVLVFMMIIGTAAFGNIAAAVLGSDNETMETRINEFVRISQQALFVDSSSEQLSGGEHVQFQYRKLL
ncbi:MAG: TetR/AcrR family transcriptional regulator [Proteobacteria bacterium]|nr:TetR/AcrR family transcriptional regulator [Pseudomonadota bacterium]